MANSESKRQKQLAKHKAKRNHKRQATIRLRNMGLAERLTRFESAPVVDCLVNTSFESEGMASLLIGRRAASGELAFFIFLVDTYCLGVKDCFGKITTAAEYRQQLERFRKHGVRSLDPPSARRLIDDAVAFAASIGLSPHPDFRRMRAILNGIDPNLAREIFPMGKGGKPFFMPGPSQSSEDSRRIMATLQSHCGPDGFHFTIPLFGADSLALGSGFEASDDKDFDEDPEEPDDF